MSYYNCSELRKHEKSWMQTNPDRRKRLLDAAIALLSARGARGLTYRAVDAEAAVPLGTTSNYFRSRAILLGEVGRRIYERLWPSTEYLDAARRHRPSRKRLITLMQDLVRRIEAQRELYLAFLELRLEATRTPELRGPLAEVLRRDFADNLAFHLSAKLPGGEREIALLTIAMTGLIVDRLTMPEVVPIGDADAFIAMLVERLVPLR